MLKVGITGGIGSGKSTVAHVFEVLGIPVYYADDAAKRLMNENEEIKHQIIKNFGEAAYENNQLNRSYLSYQIFENKEKLELLNSIVHPITIKDGASWMQQQTMPYALKEAALIFESGVQAHLDMVIGVYAPQHVRIHRVMQRDGVSREKVLQRIASQLDENIKMKLCDFVIVNDEQQSVIEQVLQIHQQLLAKK